MVQGGGQSKGGASKGGSSSEKLSEKKMRKMETRNLEEKLIVLRGALFEADGKDKDVCAALGPFMKYDRNGLDVKISFAPRLKDDVKKWAFKAVKDTMEDKYDAAGYGWDDAAPAQRESSMMLDFSQLSQGIATAFPCTFQASSGAWTCAPKTGPSAPRAA